jgi:hypothetical protein
MKKLTIILTAVILSALSARAEEVVSPIVTNKKWIAKTVSGHSAWNTEACLATTPLAAKASSSTTTASSLEVYSEKTGAIYAEPTVQILIKQPKQVYFAEVNTDKGAKWTFTLAGVPVDPYVQAVMARLKDREAVVAALRNDSTLTLRLKDNKGKTIDTLQYSLSGSAKAIDEQFKSCGLKFDVIQ